MKKVILLICFMTCTFTNYAGNNELKKEIENPIIIDNSTIFEYDFDVKVISIYNEETVSIRCWSIGVWLRIQLNKVSDDDDLIDETVDAVVDACNALEEVMEIFEFN